MSKLDENIKARTALIKDIVTLTVEARKLLQERVKELNLRCPHCGKPVTVVAYRSLLQYGIPETAKGYDQSDNAYPYECNYCDENFYECECLSANNNDTSPIQKIMDNPPRKKTSSNYKAIKEIKKYLSNQMYNEVVECEPPENCIWAATLTGKKGTKYKIAITKGNAVKFGVEPVSWGNTCTYGSVKIFLNN